MKIKHVVLLSMAVSIMGCTSKNQTIGISLQNLDTTVVAQDDFYHYACGGWMKANPLTAEYSRYGSFDVVAEENRKQLNELISSIASGQHKQGTIEQKIADLYNQAMDTLSRDQQGIEPIRVFLDEIEGLERNQLSAFLGRSMQCGMWAMYVDADEMNSSMNILKTYQGGFGLGEKEYYFDQDDETLRIRNAYEKHIANMFSLFGYSDAADKAATVLRLETRLAGAAKSNVELRDPLANYNKMSIADLKALTPEIDWDAFFAGLKISTDSISVGQIAHLQEASKMLAEEPMEDLRTYLVWQVMDGSASYLTTEIYNENFDFYGKILSGKEEPSPLWKRAVGIVNSTLGEAVGQMYVEKYFPEENKKRMLQLVANLQKALGERIDLQEWMSEETKKQAHEKLESFVVKVGYPDKWRDYSALDIQGKDFYYTNILRAAEFEQAYSLSFLDKPVDKAQWYMTPQTVNAYYNPSSNEICFPAGILQYPFFDMQADDAFNYGAIGVVIGHEMTHGFDDQGCQFDKDGNLINWWTEADKQNFDARTKVMADFFDQIEVLPGLHANGSLTLGENIADHGGLTIAFQAFRNVMAEHPLTTEEGFTPEQRFFLAYANLWAQNVREEQMRSQTKSDPHSLGEWRVNGALPHIDEWYEAWGVTPENKMYIAPENRVKIW